jgi:hypothetical protein
MKILVGTLHVIENELDDCLAAIRAQTHPAHDLFVISGKPNKEAHDVLYQTFMDRAGEVDLFIKIDADMVLTRPTFFQEVVERFASDQELTHLMISVHDWMTDSSIMGLHVFRSSHRWHVGNESKESLFVDVVDVDEKITKDRESLAPAAVHCGNPSLFQAFHFGLHKAVKFSQFGRDVLNLKQRETHWRHFKALERHYRKTRDRRLGLARVGFLHAVAQRFESRHVDYSCEETHAAYRQYAGLSATQIDARARGFGPIAWPFLPFKLRRTAANLLCAEPRVS